MYLVDTNIFLELLLCRANAQSVREFLIKTDPALIGLSDFTLHSIGVFLFRENQYDLFIRFMADILGEGDIRILSLNSEDMAELPGTAKKFQIDFDDAYQYAVARKYKLSLVSFDHDFDRTDIARVTPAELVTQVQIGE
jgi:uncharacterized protein